MAKKVNKVIFGGQTIIDVSDATADASDILEGKTAYLSNGEKATGTMVPNVSGASYCKMSDGTLIQWGTATVPQGQYVTDVLFTIPFVDISSVSIQLTQLAVGPVANVNYSASNVNRFNIGRTPNTSDNSYYWLAIGRWK